MARRTRRPLNVVSLNCSTCGCRLERQEIAAGECVYCQSGKLEAEIELHQHQSQEELVQLEAEQLWG